MATSTARAPPPARRPISVSPTTSARGSLARSAVSLRQPSSLNSASGSRRVSPITTASAGETAESLSASLKQETEQKEQLLVQVQNKDQIIASLTAENNELASALSAGETRLNELYAEQSRSELELAQRIDVAEKLRSQVRDLEREKREIQRRYNEQRVNNELQEENESYMILLREKTLSGQFDLRQVGGHNSDGYDDDDDDDHTGGTDVGSLRSTARSILDRVEEEASEDNLAHELEHNLNLDTSPDLMSRQSSRHSRRRNTSRGPTCGESLADLPITGPGLDLAAELGRAENKDMLGRNAFEERSIHSGNGKRGRKNDGRKVPSNPTGGIETSGSLNDIDALRTEVKSLRDANKALSLYASKIIDRIISQEGFEHVLAVDYEKQLSTTGSPSESLKRSPQSVIVDRSASSPLPEKRVYSPPLQVPNSKKIQRRSLSFDWKNFSLFGSQADKKPDANLRPLTLKPGATSVTGARKLDNQEDDEDRKERERMNATMKLMGIQPRTPTQITPSFSFPVSPGIQRADSTASSPSTSQPSAANNRRFSWFGSKTTADSDVSSVESASLSVDRETQSRIGLGIPSLTQGALERAEAESSLAALDAHERNLSAEIARGAGGGFTEIVPRAGGRRSRRSAGGSSGSTVWSAGMSGTGEDE
ncbi:hypothetical protein C0993_001536 [Termitomyces sp. T159_Od127]|nr:hypothetical protein C0993_001536 [Termitomyces sp. T159_Od127]